MPGAAAVVYCLIDVSISIHILVCLCVCVFMFYSFDQLLLVVCRIARFNMIILIIFIYSWLGVQSRTYDIFDLHARTSERAHAHSRCSTIQFAVDTEQNRSTSASNKTLTFPILFPSISISLQTENRRK